MPPAGPFADSIFGWPGLTDVSLELELTARRVGGEEFELGGNHCP